MSLPPLPPVINAVQQLVNDVAQPLNPPASFNDASCNKIIIIWSKSISSDDQALIATFGKVISFNSSLINVDLNTIQADYILCDASDKVCLANIEKHMGDDGIQFCHYGWSFEKDSFPGINTITKFRQAKNKADFDYSLLNPKKLSAPSKILNIVSFLVNCIANLKK